VFGPQKGATPEQVDILDAGLRRLRDRLGSALGSEAAALADAPSAGAAGGVGYAALAMLGAEPRPGIEVVLEVCRLPERMPGTDLVITGEGSLDHQSLEGKAPIGVARLARAHGVEVVAVCGRTDLAPDQAEAAGIAAVYPLTDLESDPARCIAEAGPLITELGAIIGAQLLQLSETQSRIRP
jgi:glycerate kinase